VAKTILLKLVGLPRSIWNQSPLVVPCPRFHRVLMSPSIAFAAAPQSGLAEAVAVHWLRLSDVPGVRMEAPIGREYVSSLFPVRTAFW
jgi:hypothetical protein